jgi:hypothetical protein
MKKEPSAEKPTKPRSELTNDEADRIAEGSARVLNRAVMREEHPTEWAARVGNEMEDEEHLLSQTSTTSQQSLSSNAQNKAALEIYVALMTTIRGRLDVIEAVRSSKSNDFSRAETAAFHGRKIVEGIAFACLVAVENGIRHVPRDAQGQWNAETILKSLRSKSIPTLPSPSTIRGASAAEQESDSVSVVIEGVPERRISHDDLIAIYRGMHRWLHEINPYTEPDGESFYVKHGQLLWDDLTRINRFIEKHFISISGEGFFCVLRDNVDSATKVVSLSRPTSAKMS